MRRRAVVLVVLGSLLGLGLAGCGGEGPADGTLGAATGPAAFATEHGLTDLASERVTIGRPGGTETLLELDVLVAATTSARARGLSGIATVPDGIGMLFVFPDAPDASARAGFWMLDTLVPLDIAFVADGRVVGVATMQPCAAQPCPITHPGGSYDVALETAAGVLTGAGVTVGDVLERAGPAPAG